MHPDGGEGVGLYIAWVFLHVFFHVGPESLFVESWLGVSGIHDFEVGPYPYREQVFDGLLLECKPRSPENKEG